MRVFAVTLSLLNLLFGLTAFANPICIDALKSKILPRVLFNSSNHYKQRDMKVIAERMGFEIGFVDQSIHEIDSDPISIVVHKASHFNFEEPVIVEDSSLFIEGEVGPGPLVKWQMPVVRRNFGKRATWVVYVAYARMGLVYVAKSEIHGVLVKRATDPKDGFSPLFVPDGSDLTLDQLNEDERFNPRFEAIQKLLKMDVVYVGPILQNWAGPFQPAEN
jgi:inosine/xanthosine triphosphate pyrophosphatase family protein